MSLLPAAMPAAMLAVAVITTMVPLVPALVPALVRATDPPLTLSAQAAGNPCIGQTTVCLDPWTIIICGDIGFGPQPITTMPCTGARLCHDGQCLNQEPSPPTPPPTTTTTTTTTTSRPTTTPKPSPPRDPTQACGGQVSECIDCHTRTLCARLGGRLVPVRNDTCGEDAPYCVAGECAADLPANSSCRPPAPPPSTFRCYGSGYFPDPADCTKYHLCVGEKAYDLDCGAASPGLIYDQQRAFCVPAESARCFTFNCRGRVGRYLRYGPDQTLYALCVSEDSRDALVSSCPAAQRLQPDQDDPLTVQCTPFCPHVGRFVDRDDSTGRAFLECFASPGGGASLIGPLKGSCPPGTAFDPDSERCRLSPEAAQPPPASPLPTLNPKP